MAVVRITKKAVEAVELPSAGKRAFLWDTTLKGFGVMVTSSGVRSYVLQFRIGGRGFPTRRATIGHHGNPWTAEKARARAVELAEMVRRGVDPIASERERLGARQHQQKVDAELAFDRYAALFLRCYVDAKRLRSAIDIRSVFHRDLIPWFEQKSITKIGRSDVRGLLDNVGARSGSSANKCHKWLRKMFSWAIDRGDLLSSPMTGMAAPHRDGERDRYLDDEELQTVWNAASELSYPFGPMVQLLIATGQRLREVANMRWDELDLDAREWVIPAERAKNGKQHLCPLNALAAELFASLIECRGESEFVFTTTGKGPVSGFSKAKARLDVIVATRMRERVTEQSTMTDSLQPWVLHDLRRTFATGCERLGVPVEHTEALLNHVSGSKRGIAKVYQRHHYRAEKALAAETWGQHVLKIVSNRVE